MRRIRVIHRVRTAVALLGFLLAVAAAVTLWWANHTGLPDSWRNGIEQALSRQGVHADVASLRYLPLRGIEAGEVTVFTDESRERILGRFHSLLLDVDRTKLTRGEFRIDRLDLSGASVSLPVDATDPETKTLDITELKGRMEFSANRRLTITGASGSVGGLRLAINGNLLLYRGGSDYDPEAAQQARAERRRILSSIVDTLDSFELDPKSAPRIRADISGDFEEPGSFRASAVMSANDIRSRELEIKRLEIQAEMRNRTLVIHRVDIDAIDGRLNGKAEMDLAEMQGDFELHSDLDLTEILTKLRLPLPEVMPTFGRPPVVDVKGNFGNGSDGWELQMMGLVDLHQPSLLNYSADRVRTSFSWDGPRLLLEDFTLLEGPRSVTGRAFITPESVLYQGSGNLSVPFVQKSIAKLKPLARILGDFSATEQTEVQGTFSGRANPKDKTDWEFMGNFEAREISYRGVPAKFARVDLDLTRDRLDFSKGEVEFDYRDYPLRKRHDGPDSGRVEVGLIRYDRPDSTIAIENLKGTAWPAPILRTFAPKVADSIEGYGFHSTPTLSAAGLIGIKDGQPKQDLLIRFKSAAPINYEFLDQELTLTAPEGEVRVLPGSVRISDTSVGAFGGLVRLDLTAPTDGSSMVSGEIDWTHLALPEISRTYEFDSTPSGKVTGRLEFSLQGGVAGLDGRGHLALEESELFDVPIFGPLSPAIAAVLGNRKAGFQEAQSAFFSMDIENGVVSTEDFVTTTPSLIFTGDGKADLTEQELDMTIRMNARGFLGIITLPLRPFYGLFQFRGTGPLSKPEWQNVMFTSPPPAQEEKLLTPPKARAVPEIRGTVPKATPAPSSNRSRISPRNR